MESVFILKKRGENPCCSRSAKHMNKHGRNYHTHHNVHKVFSECAARLLSIVSSPPNIAHDRVYM